MKELWEIESAHYAAGEKALKNWANDEGFIYNDGEVYDEVFVQSYEFVVDCANLTPAQVADFQDLLYSINEDEKAFVSGCRIYLDDVEFDTVDIDCDFFIYRRWRITDDEFDEIYSVMKDYEKLGAQFVFASIDKGKYNYVEVEYC